MKKIATLAFTLIINYSVQAQNRIDDKYKNPSLGNKTSTTVVKPNLTKDMLVKIYGKSQSELVFDKCQAEYDSFNQNGDEVWIYADEFFNGNKKILKVGDYTLLGSATTRELGTNWNDKISSMLIPNSLKIIVFMDDKFNGLKAETSGFGVINMESGAIGFKGDYYIFQSQGRFSKGGIYFQENKVGAVTISANDQISSLKIFR
jgi:hypothetical protein